MTKELTLTGKLFKSYAEDLIKKDRFGTNRMLGFPTFWIALEKEYEQNEELVNQKLAEHIEEAIAKRYREDAEFVESWNKEHANRKTLFGEDWTIRERTEQDIFFGKTEAEYRVEHAKDFHWVGVCEARMVATRQLEDARKFLLDNGYLREWKKKAPFGKNAYCHYYGLTAKGWSIAQKYLNA